MSTISAGVLASKLSGPALLHASATLGISTASPLYPLLVQLMHHAHEVNTLLHFTSSRKLRGFNTRVLLHDEVERISDLHIEYAFICSVPLAGMAGMVFDTASHFFVVLIGSEGEKRKRWGGLLQSHFDCTGYVFEFGLADDSAAVEGPSAVSLYAIHSISVANNHKDEIETYSKELKRHNLAVRAETRCSCALIDAFKLAVELGKKTYSLSDYNCKAYARSLIASIQQGRAVYESDASNNKMLKAVAGFVVGGSH